METNTLEPTLKSHFLNLYSLALADTQIDTVELEMLYKIGTEKGVDKETIEQLIVQPDKIKFCFPETVLEKIEYLYDFTRIIWADNQLDKYERKALEMFCSKFGFEDANVPAIAGFLIEEVKKGTSKEMICEIVKQNL